MHHELVELEIPVSDLRVGMHVVRLDRPWEDTDFPLQGFIITRQDDIDALQDQCKTVVIEGKVMHRTAPVEVRAYRKPEKSSFLRFFGAKDKRDATPKPRNARPENSEGYVTRPRITYINKVDVSREIGSAQDSYSSAKALAKNIMTGIRVGRALDINKAREVVDACVDSLLRNDDALLWLTKIKHKDDYTAEHSLNVSILAAAFARHLGMLEGEIRSLGLCGLLHDVGKVKIPDEILKKPGSLSADEYEAMKAHCNYGRDILMSLPKVVHATVDVAYNHHERLDGQGYPRGLKAEQIPYWAKLVSVVDAYDAITSARVYDRARSSMEALEIIYRGRGSQFDAELADEFIRMIGIYPPGSIVEMTNGEVGIVIASNPKNKRRPKVILVRDADKRPRPKYRVVDMVRNVKDPGGADYVIAREVPDQTYGIVLQDFLDEGLVLGHQTIDETSV